MVAEVGWLGGVVWSFVVCGVCVVVVVVVVDCGLWIVVVGGLW